MRLIVFLAGLSVSAAAAFAQAPDFGPNVSIFSPNTPRATMQQEIDKVYAIEQHNEFGTERHAFLFLPGEYHVNVPIGFYTEVAGLGKTPDATHLIGDVHVDAAARNNNATTTFWRAAENFAVTPTGGTMRWAVSQAAPMRRLHVLGNLMLHQHGWASGGWMSDTLVDGEVDSGPQQQWISRNCDWKIWKGSNWNMVFVGVPEAPAGNWPQPTFTEVEKAPLELEKPYLVAVDAQHWSIVVPQLRRDTSGTSWDHGVQPPARTVSFRNVYVAHPGTDTAASLNAQLAKGMNLLFTPGIYELEQPLKVTHANTIIMGLGFATLKPMRGNAAVETSDADGIVLTGLLIDAGEQKSPVLVQIGPRGSSRNHHDHPIAVEDVFFRVGGAGIGKTNINLEINSRGTIVDHTWIWCADHGDGVGWDKNVSNNGIVVNGDDVTIYGLFVEHHQQFQVLWNGNAGRTYFYQSEIPYDPPNQAAFSSAPGVNGWASYKVSDAVKQHEAWGLGVYSVFTHPDVFLSHAIETPQSPQVRFHHMITVCLGNNGGIRHVIDKAGDPTECAPHRVDSKLAEYPIPRK
ncbi:MAG TPA: coagulation factor 5/8 type domain-containing protein [Candidatus Aquilonibacter sp.]|nr:coagulation factor 5/8 type domain-containing protein [Candidatus Aquilonibacter sp.]